MKTLCVPDPLLVLHGLDGPFMLATDGPGAHVAYLDFTDTLTLDAERAEEGVTRLAEPAAPTGLSFSGRVGFFGYEFLAALLGLSLSSPRDLDLPDGFFARPATLLRLGDGKVEIESADPAREEELARLLPAASAPDAPAPDAAVTCNLSFERYQEIFARAKEAILDGETYQIKLSQRHEVRAGLDPVTAFRRLHAENPSPEAFLVRHPDFALASCSPEVVIDSRGGRIVTRPIGGTYERRKGEDRKSVVSRFLCDPKEVAEHNMLVDLERNDLSTVCLPGSVRIARFREVETYAHLHHFVSTIEGTLKPGASLLQILRALLPGGTITGCPKLRTIELIDSLEPTFRGPYTGSFGTIADNGDLCLNLIIRALLFLGGTCYAQAGGGIVVDSTPEYEYRENALKARALLDLFRRPEASASASAATLPSPA
mgnify:CR=1 FL=1